MSVPLENSKRDIFKVAARTCLQSNKKSHIVQRKDNWPFFFRKIRYAEQTS